ncbi:MAG: 50S ribosomal protein L10, partial [Planctomycetia bacterium]
MSKYVKELEMKYLRKRFEGVHDLMVVDVIGLNSLETFNLRRDLRKKKIEISVVRNNIARIVFREMGLPEFDKILDGTSAVAWGSSDAVSLAKEMLAQVKTNAKFKVKGGCVSGQVVDSKGVETVSKMPTREETLSLLVGLIMAPGASLAALLAGPGGAIVGQIKTLAEKGADAASEATAEAAADAAPEA